MRHYPPGKPGGLFGGEAMITSKEIGRKCKRFRQFVLHMSVKDVAKCLGYSPGNIYAFEAGRNCNYYLLLWYVEQGLVLDSNSVGGGIRGK